MYHTHQYKLVCTGMYNYMTISSQYISVHVPGVNMCQSPDDNVIDQSILTCILGPSPINFRKAILDFKDNKYLSALQRLY